MHVVDQRFKNRKTRIWFWRYLHIRVLVIESTWFWKTTICFITILLDDIFDSCTKSFRTTWECAGTLSIGQKSNYILDLWPTCRNVWTFCNRDWFLILHCRFTRWWERMRHLRIITQTKVLFLFLDDIMFQLAVLLLLIERTLIIFGRNIKNGTMPIPPTNSNTESWWCNIFLCRQNSAWSIPSTRTDGVEQKIHDFFCLIKIGHLSFKFNELEEDTAEFSLKKSISRSQFKSSTIKLSIVLISKGKDISPLCGSNVTENGCHIDKILGTHILQTPPYLPRVIILLEQDLRYRNFIRQHPFKSLIHVINVKNHYQTMRL